MEWDFSGRVIEWRGPSPFFYVAMPPDDAEELKDVGRSLIYWGQMPVTATIGGTTFKTALFPRDGTYMVPLKVAVRRTEKIELGDHVRVTLRIDLRD
jgi:hypothetical protein